MIIRAGKSAALERRHLDRFSRFRVCLTVVTNRPTDHGPRGMCSGRLHLCDARDAAAE